MEEWVEAEALELEGVVVEDYRGIENAEESAGPFGRGDIEGNACQGR